MKYKILAFSLFAFLILMMVLLFGPKSGIDGEIYKASNIDSIKIVHSNKTYLISKRSDIYNLAGALIRAERIVSPEGRNLNNDFYDLFFDVKSKSQKEVRVLFNSANGIMIVANDYYYRGDSLHKLIKSIVGE